MIAKHQLRTLALACISAASVATSCGSHEWLDLNPEMDIKAPTFRMTGEVQYLDVEGGIFAIHSTDGTNYNPVNLPDSYKVDKMAVEADARVRTDLVSAAMIGPVVELLRIRAVGDH